MIEGLGEARRRVKLSIRYNGQFFLGFQIQHSGPTVCGELSTVLSRLLGHKITVVGAGRTDKGVHAMGQVVHADVPLGIGNQVLLDTLRACLEPQRIQIVAIESVDTNFQARFDAKSRVYDYHLVPNGAGDIGLALAPWVWRVEPGTGWSLTRFKQALTFYQGKHDFSRFTVTAREAIDPVREIFSVSLKKLIWQEFLIENAEPVRLYRIRIVGQGFLRQMVRFMVAAAVEVGQGHLTLAELKNAVQNKVDIPRRLAAPPQGLVLRQVNY